LLVVVVVVVWLPKGWCLAERQGMFGVGRMRCDPAAAPAGQAAQAGWRAKKLCPD